MKPIITKTMFIFTALVAAIYFDTICTQQQTPTPIKKKHQTGEQKKKRQQQSRKVPITFGKTHFIVGFPHATFKQEQQKDIHKNLSHLVTSDGTVKRALFAPDDNIKDTIIELIKYEQDSIKIAIFSFTNEDIAQAIIKVADSGIPVELIIDPSTLRDPFNKIKHLHEHGVHVFIYQPTRSKTLMVDKMHDKFILFGKNMNDKQLLWTGSFNFTKSASYYNQENVVILDDRLLIDQFTNQFARLKQRSSNYRTS